MGSTPSGSVARCCARWTGGGDPDNKAIAVTEGDQVRISPRKSFERWREIAHQRSEPWTPGETESAEALRRYLVESLYGRTRGALRVAETLQRSLLPQSIPTLEVGSCPRITSRPRAITSAATGTTRSSCATAG